MRALVLPILILPSVAAAANTCPWLNAATAGGVLGGQVTNLTITRAHAGDDATCEFIRRDGSLLLDLRIEVETMPSPAKDFATYAARCHSAAVPLKAIGNEALSCNDEGAGQIVGRVRDRAFVVRISTTDHSTSLNALSEKARKIAEQVAGILF
jgi:hypothetical protein